jgi:hypothetical protein
LLGLLALGRGLLVVRFRTICKIRFDLLIVNKSLDSSQVRYAHLK